MIGPLARIDYTRMAPSVKTLEPKTLTEEELQEEKRRERHERQRLRDEQRLHQRNIKELSGKLGQIHEAHDIIEEQLSLFENESTKLLLEKRVFDQFPLERDLRELVKATRIPSEHREAVKAFEQIQQEGGWWMRYK